jgi:hypothetical protein
MNPHWPNVASLRTPAPLRRRSNILRSSRSLELTVRYARKVVVLFPIAFVWVIAVIVWVIRNEVTPEQDRARRWARLRPRPPRSPRRGRPNGSPTRSSGRRSEARASSSAERARR